MPSIRKKSRSYAGRQVDLELLKHVEDPAEYTEFKEVVPDLTPVPRIVSGIEKAVQRYARVFLTTSGSCRMDREDGNDLLKNIAEGKVSYQSTLEHLVYVANASTLETLAVDDGDSAFGEIPDDERIVGAEVLDVRVARDVMRGNRVIAHIRIDTAAGEDFTFLIPVNAGV